MDVGVMMEDGSKQEVKMAISSSSLKRKHDLELEQIEEPRQSLSNPSLLLPKQVVAQLQDDSRKIRNGKKTNFDFKSEVKKPKENGPLYPKEEQSNPFVLYQPQNSNDRWNKETNPNGIVDVILKPELLNGTKENDNLSLMQDQKDGLKFMWDSYNKGQGCILAHEMGLGKTRTAITLILTLWEQSENCRGQSKGVLKKCMILGPKAAVSVWDEEFKKWQPMSIGVKVEAVLSDQSKAKKLSVIQSFLHSKSPQILILSYETFKTFNSQNEDGFKSFNKNFVDLVICDEAHVLKNKKIQRVDSLEEFKLSAKIWMGLTGSLYQNNLEELCNLINFFRPKTLGEDYKEMYCKPIEKFLKQKRLGEAKNLLEVLKAQILPVVQYKWNNINVEKHEMIICVPLSGVPRMGNLSTQIQHRMYTELVDLFAVGGIEFFNQLDYLTKACIHPTYLVQSLREKPGLFQHIIDIYNAEWKDLTIEERLVLSGKISLVLEMAAYINKNENGKHTNEKVIIVSSSKEGTLQLVKQAFKMIDGLDNSFVEYNGDMCENARKASLEKFENNVNVKFLFLSLKAGGTCLSLTRANHMIVLDPDWNPANDQQVLHRIYRYGQTRPVFMYRFLSTGTIEEAKYIRQLSKEELDKYFKDQSGNKQGIQIPNEGRDLFNYYPDALSRIQDVVDEIAKDQQDKKKFDIDVRDFAANLSKSKKYKSADQVPEILDVIKNNFDGYISYIFHKEKREVSKTVDEFIENIAKSSATESAE